MVTGLKINTNQGWQANGIEILHTGEGVSTKNVTIDVKSEGKKGEGAIRIRVTIEEVVQTNMCDVEIARVGDIAGKERSVTMQTCRMPK